MNAETSSLRSFARGGGSILGWVGRRTLVAALYLVDLAVFIVQAFVDWRLSILEWNRATARPLVWQTIFTGLDAVPVISLLALTIGVAITSQLIPLAEALGTEEQTAALLAAYVGMELSSIATAIVIIGRSGSAIVVDLGNMTLHKEVEALELLGMNVNDFFVTPRLIATAISQLILATLFAVLALFGGIAISGFVIAPSYYNHLLPVLVALGGPELLLFVIKNLLFGLIIAGTACFHALQVTRSPTEVPQQTQRAIVNSLIIVFLLDGVFAYVASI